MTYVLNILKGLPVKEKNGGNEIFFRKAYRHRYIECALCKGSGLRDGTGYAKCQVCGGMGTVRVHPPVMTCVFCRGEGHQSWGPLTCPVCRGKGVVAVKEPIATCPECGGTGESMNPQLYCMRCRGKGVISPIDVM